MAESSNNRSVFELFCPHCDKPLKEENYGAPNPSGSKPGLTLLECKNRHAFKIDWRKMSLVEMFPA